MNAFEYLTADSYAAAAACLAKHPKGTLLKSGGIDVLDRLKERLDTPARVLSLKKLHDPATSVEQRDGMLVIHALTTLADIAAHADVKKHFPALADAAGHAATPQVRNVATLGGNLCQKPRCWYYRNNDFPCLKKGGSTCYAVDGDNRFHAVFGAGACHIVNPSNTAPPLMAYAASVRVVRDNGGKLAERVVAIDDFYRVPANPQDNEHALEPGEIVREIMIPLQAGGAKSGYLELREKQSFDWPLVTCVVNLNDPAKPRVVCGAVAPIPWRMKKVESLIAGKALTGDLADQAGKAAMEGAVPMTHNAYKVTQVGEAVARTLRAAAGIA